MQDDLNIQALVQQAADCLAQTDPLRKVEMTGLLHGSFQLLPDSTLTGFVVPALQPGRPDQPALVHFSKLPARKIATKQGRAAFIHALAHIEFNAINLAWDAVCRFPGMPAAYYRDWSRVAAEEALHFCLLADRLRDLGSYYGEFEAHNGLWDMAEKTAHDPLVRMALVPRVLEARGLDVTPSMLERLQDQEDTASVTILQRILDDEIGHVDIGSRWFNYLCDQRGLVPAETFATLLAEQGMERIRKPLNLAARRLAGFGDEELEMLEILAGKK